MVTGVTARFSQSGLLIGAASASKSEVKVVAIVPSTQVPALGASQSTFMTICCHAVIDAVVAIWRAVLGIDGLGITCMRHFVAK